MQAGLTSSEATVQAGQGLHQQTTSKKAEEHQTKQQHQQCMQTQKAEEAECQVAMQ